MAKRFLSIWFCSLKTDWLIRRRPSLKEVPFVLASPDHGRMIITAANAKAQDAGVDKGIALADARALIPGLQFFEDEPERAARSLTGLAEWCIRYSPVVAIDPPDGLILDITGCAHLWGGEQLYLTEICKRLRLLCYHNRAAIADTVGAAWAIARFGKDLSVIESHHQAAALLALPSPALRLEMGTVERLDKLGLRQIRNFINMPRAALRRRFGMQLLLRLDQAIGYEEEAIQPVAPIEPYQERLHCLEPIVTATGIGIALEKLLDTLCQRLKQEEKGLRSAVFKCYRVDAKVETIEIGTHRPSVNSRHLYKLFESKIPSIEPALGIELFTLLAPLVEESSPMQEKLWQQTGLCDTGLSELMDRLAGKIGPGHIHRYIPAEHYWPERSFKPTGRLQQDEQAHWKINRPRPLQLLKQPELVEVAAPVPDYPPMHFRYKGVLHKIVRSDGPERIEPEWWLQEGKHRDYYCVEDEAGQRYWLFRSGHYDAAKSYRWFIHGFFA